MNIFYFFESLCFNGIEIVVMYYIYGLDSNGVYGDEVFFLVDKELFKNKVILSYFGIFKGLF